MSERGRTTSPVPEPGLRAWPGRGQYDVVAVGGSAGSFALLLAMLPRLPGDFPWPVLAVVHLHPRQKGGFVDLLDQRCSLRVKEAEDKEAIAPGHVYFAPPDYHLLLEPGLTLALSADDKVRFSRPSIDVLFESAALACRSRLVGVLLSGAGDDGARGLCSIWERGGLTVVQNPARAEHPAMPLAALEALRLAGALAGSITAGPGHGPDHVLDAEGIVELLAVLAGAASGRAGPRAAAAGQGKGQ